MIYWLSENSFCNGKGGKNWATMKVMPKILRSIEEIDEKNTKQRWKIKSNHTEKWWFELKQSNSGEVAYSNEIRQAPKFH